MELADLTILEVTELSPVHSLLRTNAPDVVVKVTKFDAFSEMREILTLSTGDVVIDRGPTVHKDKVFGGAVRVYVSWPSGKASSLDEMDREITYMRLARWMQEEMEAGI